MDIKHKVTLRNFHEDDVHSFMEWAGDADVARWSTWDVFPSKEKAREFLKNVAIPHPWFKAICLNGKAIGWIVMVKGKGVNCCRAEMGFVIGRQFWGKGYIAEALKQALATVFEDLKVQRIDALAYPENVASQKVLLQAGFVWEGLFRKFMIVKGRLRDCMIFSVLAPTL